MTVWRWRRRTDHDVAPARPGDALSSLLFAGVAAFASPAWATDPAFPEEGRESAPLADQASKDTAKGHGSFAVGYQNTDVDGMFVDGVPGGKLAVGNVRIQSVSLDLDYFFADEWSTHIGIPYIESRYQGPGPHCPTAQPPQCKGQPALAQPHPESRFLDDGNYHGAWQDWTLGVSYHANLDDYLVVPSLTLYQPSHQYTFFANAAVGQDLRKLEVSLDVSHQFEFTDLYYRIIAGHAFTPTTLGQNIDYNRVSLELGYFVNEALAVKVYSNAKKGHGYFGGYDLTTELWYHHDQRAPHNYANVGTGFDYRLDDKYTVSTTIEHLVWGRIVYDFRYSLDVRLTREF